VSNYGCCATGEKPKERKKPKLILPKIDPKNNGGLHNSQGVKPAKTRLQTGEFTSIKRALHNKCGK